MVARPIGPGNPNPRTTRRLPGSTGVYGGAAGGMLVVALLTTCNDSCPSPNAARFRHLANLRRGGCGGLGAKARRRRPHGAAGRRLDPGAGGAGDRVLVLFASPARIGSARGSGGPAQFTDPGLGPGALRPGAVSGQQPVFCDPAHELARTGRRSEPRHPEGAAGRVLAGDGRPARGHPRQPGPAAGRARRGRSAGGLDAHGAHARGHRPQRGSHGPAAGAAQGRSAGLRRSGRAAGADRPARGRGRPAAYRRESRPVADARQMAGTQPQRRDFAGAGTGIRLSGCAD